VNLHCLSRDFFNSMCTGCDLASNTHDAMDEGNLWDQFSSSHPSHVAQGSHQVPGVSSVRPTLLLHALSLGLHPFYPSFTGALPSIGPRLRAQQLPCQAEVGFFLLVDHTCQGLIHKTFDSVC
jgi:hypothetical protein